MASNNQTKMTSSPMKRKNDQLDSPTEKDMRKKIAYDFKFNSAFHQLTTDKFSNEAYNKNTKDGKYKVNVRRADRANINRIGFGKAMRLSQAKDVIDCKKVSRNMICVTFNKRESANKFAENSEEMLRRGYVTTIPVHYRAVVGVVKEVPVDVSAKEILDEIGKKNPVLKIVRMTRKMKNGHRDYSLNVKIFFEGDTLPTEVAIYGGKERVHPYIAPVLQCSSCLRYGHHAKACKSSANKIQICSNCGNCGHQSDRCRAAQPSCVHCKETHDALSRECPERVRQNNIRILMTNERLSFQEVLEKHPQYTSKNQFSLLENLNEFPALNRVSYKRQLTAGLTKTVKLPYRRIKVNAPKQAEKYSSYYSELQILTDPTTPMAENPNRVTEEEKLKTVSANQNHVEETKEISSDYEEEDMNITIIETHSNTMEENNAETINSLHKSS